jgi:agmatine deiminase
MTETAEVTGRVRMPAEWEPHERCLMAWPARLDLWGPYLERAKAEYAATANAIAQFEPVTMVVNPHQAAEARAACSGAIELIEAPIDDSWLRDSGPIFVSDDAGRRYGVDFDFNSWGGRFVPWEADRAITRIVLERLGLPRIASPMVLEGGSITVDGEGTLITTEQCLLNPNRNPGMSRTDIEAELARTLGVTKVIWLRWGHVEDTHTDGHVDGVATYVAPGKVLVQTCEDPGNPNFELMAENVEILQASTDARGRPIQMIELPQFPYFDLDGERLATSYPNFYLANGAVIVPIAGLDIDRDALEVIAEAFPGREVVGVESRIVAFGGGGTHCITQQLPAAPPV